MREGPSRAEPRHLAAFAMLLRRGRFCSTQVKAQHQLLFSFHNFLFLKNTGVCVLLHRLSDKGFINSVFVWTSPRGSVQPQPGCRAYDKRNEKSRRRSAPEQLTRGQAGLSSVGTVPRPHIPEEKPFVGIGVPLDRGGVTGCPGSAEGRGEGEPARASTLTPRILNNISFRARAFTRIAQDPPICFTIV